MVSFRRLPAHSRVLLLASLLSSISITHSITPAGDDCNIEVKVDCVDLHGTHCQDLTAPFTECSAGEEITLLQFKLIDSDCYSSGNTQDEKFDCQETSTSIPEGGSIMYVSCFSESENGPVIYLDQHIIGDVIELEDRSGLPETVVCTIKNDQGKDIQKLTMDTSGSYSLYLKNTFGMFQLEACSIQNSPIQTCVIPILYTYTFTSTDESNMGIGKIEETRNKRYRDISDEPMTRTGDTTSMTVEENIDICIPESYQTMVVVEGETRMGTPCYDLNVYAFNFTGLGQLDIDISCESVEGHDCKALPQRTDNCWTEIHYTFDVRNIGNVDLFVEYLEVLQNGHDLDAAFLAQKNLVPGEETTVDYVDHVNSCVSGKYETTAIAKAFSSSIGMFQNSETYNFEIIVTPQPTVAPTPLASSSPSTSHSPSISLQPSTSHSPTVSSAPSISASPSVLHECEVGIALDCLAPVDISPDGSCTFEYKEPPGCEQTPEVMTLKYRGGACDTSSNLQLMTGFSCEDYLVGPVVEGLTSYITVFGELGNAIFSGFVKMGSEFVVSGEFGSTMNILIYDTKGFTDTSIILKPKNIIQTITFDVSCDNNLFIKDKFGAVQLSQFTNEVQGTISNIQGLTLHFEVSGMENLELSAMEIVTNIETESFGIFNITNKVAGKAVSPGISLVDNQPIAIDLGQITKYTAVATVVGNTLEGHKCYGSNGISFTAGAPLPTSVPSAPPTNFPSISPTPDPRKAHCNLDASISCMTRDGESCFNLKSPASKTCLGGIAEELSFFYLPSSMCDESNSKTGFTCTDFNSTDVSRPFEAFVSILEGGNILFGSIVRAGNIFKVQVPSSASIIEIEISTVMDGNRRIILQKSTMSVRCRHEDGLTLLHTFGNLQLIGFKNSEMGSQKVYEDVELTYTVTNLGLYDANLLTATVDGTTSGIDEVLGPEDPKIAIAPNESESYVTPSTINLAESSGFSYEFYFDIIGEGALSGLVCHADSSLSFKVAEAEPTAQCSAHAGCAGLVGDCCPRADGLFLLCCY